MAIMIIFNRISISSTLTCTGHIVPQRISLAPSTVHYTYHMVSWIDGSNWINRVSTSCNEMEPTLLAKSSSSKSLEESMENIVLVVLVKYACCTRQCYFVGHFHSYLHHEIDRQPNEHSVLELARKQLLYNGRQNGRDNMSRIESHPRRNRSHRREHDTE